MVEKIEKRTIRIPQGAAIGPEFRPIYGHTEVEAHCLGGLAVHKAIGGRGWEVTHESSGLKLGPLHARTKARALANMRAALDLDVDWTLSESKALAAVRKSRGIVDSIRAIGADE